MRNHLPLKAGARRARVAHATVGYEGGASYHLLGQQRHQCQALRSGVTVIRVRAALFYRHQDKWLGRSRHLRAARTRRDVANNHLVGLNRTRQWLYLGSHHRPAQTGEQRVCTVSRLVRPSDGARSPSCGRPHDEQVCQPELGQHWQATVVKDRAGS
jgi:hypothetical protein